LIEKTFKSRADIIEILLPLNGNGNFNDYIQKDETFYGFVTLVEFLQQILI
jgi:hypothetical protein